MNIKLLGYTFRLEIILLIVVVYFVISANVVCSCSRVNANGWIDIFVNTLNIFNKEGFQGIQSLYYLDDKSNLVDTNNWKTPDMSTSVGSQDILNRPEQPVPLEANNMILFKETKFDPKCCPNAYSTSGGCACMTVDQYSYLHKRGGNNVPNDTGF
jgi:hypothetical protein